MNSESSRPIDLLHDLASVCLFLGPYRNLTTLSASLLALHPECQVLNHGSKRVFGAPDLNFLVDYSPAKFERFCRFALDASTGDRQGPYGGSVVVSHAFDHESMRQAYVRRYGARRLKERVRCLAWKEPHRVTNLLRERGLRPEDLSRENPVLRFLMPIRNPLDCMISNCVTGHVQYFSHFDPAHEYLSRDAGAVGPDWATIVAPARAGRPEERLRMRLSDAERLIGALLDEYLWFIERAEAHPEHFLYFFQDELAEPVLFERLARFLNLSAADWASDALLACQISPGYRCDRTLVQLYRELVEQRSHGHPAFAGRLQAAVTDTTA